MTWAGFARGNADGLRREQYRDRRRRRGPVREVETDLRLHVDRFATGQQVELQHQIGAGIERPGDGVRERRRGLAGRPAQEMARGESRVVEHQTVVTRIGIFGIEGSRCTGPIQQDAGMVDHTPAAGARPQLYGAHPSAGHPALPEARSCDRHRRRRRAAGTAPPWERRGPAGRAASRCRPRAERGGRPDPPCVAPVAAHRDSSAISLSDRRRWFRKLPCPGTGFQGGILPLGGDRGNRRRPLTGVRVGGQAERADCRRDGGSRRSGL